MEGVTKIRTQLKSFMVDTTKRFETLESQQTQLSSQLQETQEKNLRLELDTNKKLELILASLEVNRRSDSTPLSPLSQTTPIPTTREGGLSPGTVTPPLPVFSSASRRHHNLCFPHSLCLLVAVLHFLQLNLLIFSTFILFQISRTPLPLITLTPSFVAYPYFLTSSDCDTSKLTLHRILPPWRLNLIFLSLMVPTLEDGWGKLRSFLPFTKFRSLRSWIISLFTWSIKQIFGLIAILLVREVRCLGQCSVRKYVEDLGKWGQWVLWMS